MIKKLVLVSACFCLLAASKAEENKVVVKEVFFTTDQSRENIDSPAVWHAADGRNLLFATSKAGHSVNVFDAENGAMVQRLGGLGSELGQFSRPNGVWVVDDYMLVVERDNRRVQVVYLPTMVGIATFGEEQLGKPYGLYVQPLGGGEYAVYVADNYETADEEIPADRDLNHRINRYLLETAGSTADAEWETAFGATSGDGRLYVVESVFGDPVHNRLLVAEELEDDSKGRQVKVYDLDGQFTGKTFGKGIFKNQVEGIALYEVSAKAGYWIVTDQGKIENWFHVFDRESLEYRGSFSGERTLNTDGIWLSQKATPRYPHGLFYACDNDRAISAFDLGEVLKRLGLKTRE
ncbi:phytase [Pelagicoccus sp. NFK12]|uniref:Phytase n=1 Tax=Pelagicoccus enzymogenes TaxID=2773457 RepID=A0A927F7C3_9BACT|nr:phytase [Pelagicoccus enzymogenes]MBD5779305.1 phytase [Pelagicoccus enzymogenes]